jgi:hypothetical protein
LQTVRETFGGALLLAIEVLVAADLIRTVAVEPTLDNVAALGMIVLIRTFLSFSPGSSAGRWGEPPGHRADTCATGPRPPWNERGAALVRVSPGGPRGAPCGAGDGG